MRTSLTGLRRALAAVAITAAALVAPAEAQAPQRLVVHESNRYIVDETGAPFFYLGDTAWELFHRLTYEEALEYLDDRAAKGFTVVQAVALAEIDGLNDPTPAGYRPLLNNNPLTPDVKDGPNNDYWDHVEAVIDAANARGIVVGLLPTWGDKWYKKWGLGPVIFTPENAGPYGEWIGRRFKDKSVIWIMGGDRNIDEPHHRPLNEAMARGVRRGSDGRHLMTFHPQGGASSADWFHDADWLDFNFRQNGHNTEYHEFEGTLRDYQRTPIKPVMDGEPIYEDHPIKFEPQKFGHSIALDVRRPLYWDLFNGAFGHTYGHHSIWQMYAPGRQGINFPLMPWREAMQAPGVGQMQHGKRLLQSRPNWASRVPDPSLIVTGAVPTAMPGAGALRLVGTRAADGSWAMIYTPAGRPFEVNLAPLTGDRLRAWWFDPRTGAARQAGTFEKTATRRFETPTPGEYMDWVLVLDDASKRYRRPGG